MSGSVSTASNFVATLVLTKGEDFVRRLGEQDIRIYPVTARALAGVIAGRSTVSVFTLLRALRTAACPMCAVNGTRRAIEATHKM